MTDPSSAAAASDPDGRIAAARAALLRDPHDVGALRALADALSAAGRHREAAARLRQATASRPDDPLAWHALARALLQGDRATPSPKDAQEARAALERAVALAPDFATAHVALGDLRLRRGAPDDAERHYGRAIDADPTWSVPHANLGVVALQRGRVDAAIAHYERAVALDGDDVEAANGLGAARLLADDAEGAVAVLAAAHSRSPEHPATALNLGRAWRAVGDFAAATTVHRALVAAHPAFAEAWDELALDRSADGDHDGALDAMRRALALEPRRVLFQIHLGNLLAEARDPAAALDAYRRALRLDPRSALARWNLALLELATGAFAAGWDDYEARWDCAEFPSPKRTFDRPLLQPGQPVAGRTVLVHAEQGLGDTLQFMRLVPALIARGADVVFEVQAPLARLLRASGALGRVVVRGDALPPFDAHVPLLSLPRVLAQPDPDASTVPYLPAGRAASGRPRRIGLAWAGSRDLAARRRSPPLARLADWFDVPGATWIGLQKQLPSGDEPLVHALAARGVALDAGTALADFAETAELVASLDLVVTVDTAVAHLAGAMGTPVWILLPAVADFRWLIDRDDSPWYPTARLFRCGPAGWDPVIAAVLDALRDALAG